MLLMEFKNLDQPDQLNKIFWEGVKMGKRAVNNRNIELWHLYDFYLEILYDKKDDALIKLVVADNESIVNQYLN